jgi:hypothetical protein
VYELCRDEPDTAPQLLGLIDRYYRLGRMPAPQFQKLKAKIEQAMGTRPLDDDEDESADSADSDTRELRATDVPAPRPAAAPPRFATPPRARRAAQDHCATSVYGVTAQRRAARHRDAWRPAFQHRARRSTSQPWLWLKPGRRR